jgi:tetratricopeptide (TPR) repeat protein
MAKRKEQGGSKARAATARATALEMMSTPSTWVVYVLILAATLFIFGQVRHFQLIDFDDLSYVTDNSRVTSGLSMDNIRWAFTHAYEGNWIPLTWISYMVDYELGGLDGAQYHLTNVVLHIATACLLFWILHALTLARLASAFVALLFAVHPLHVESVSWVAERKDVLSALFWCLTIAAYVRYVRRPSAVAYLLVAAAFVASLMAKPMAVTLPFVLLLLDYWPLRRVSGTQSLTRLVLEKWPFFLLTIASCIITFQAQRAEAVMDFERHPLSARLANVPVAAAGYLLKMIWPTDLAILYPLPKHLPAVQVALSVLVLFAISAGVWFARRRFPYALMGWLWFFGMLIPVIGLVQVGVQAMADRYTYLPLIGVFVVIAWGARDVAARVRRSSLLFGGMTALLLAGCLILTSRQLFYWRTSETLFTHAVAVTQDNDVARINLGVALEQAGKSDDALRHYTEALRINPNSAQAHNNLANLLANSGRRAEAQTHYREALRLKPNAPLAHSNFGTLLVELGQVDEALDQYAEAARLASDDPRPYYLMGKARLRQGQSAEAIARFRDALRRDPNDVQTLAYLARVLAADENSSVRNGPEAVAVAQRANELTGGEQAFLLDTLAMAYAEAGRFNDATATIQKAIDLATAAGDKEAVVDMQPRLRAFQAGKPYRENFTNVPIRSPAPE